MENQSPKVPKSVPPVTLSVDRLVKECEITFTRRGGPGGQHRNKVSSAVVMKHIPSGVIAEASERRSQAENRAVALQRLRIALALQLRDDTSGHCVNLVQRYGGWRLRVSGGNDDYPIVLADILNRINQHDGALDDAAAFWKTSASQIVRFLKAEPQALAVANGYRERCGKHRLK